MVFALSVTFVKWARREVENRTNLMPTELDYRGLCVSKAKEAKMERIVLRHLNGSKADHEDRFPLSEFKEIAFGRDPSSTVRFSETDTVVGRQHAKITRNIAIPSRFFIIDLDSRNGTFVNGR